jgi:carbonic anhydrase
MYTHTKEFRESITPELALTLLKEGNDRFVKNLKANRDLLQQVNATAEGQLPFAAVLSCMDSRTSPELIFDQGLGDIFSIRVAGNILNNDILGSMEYATKVVGTKLILVLGHTRCGAVTGACNGVEMGHLTGLLEKIKPAIGREEEIKENRTGNNDAFLKKVTELNVVLTIEQIRTQSKIIKELEREWKVMLAGGIYEIETGRVIFMNDIHFETGKTALAEANKITVPGAEISLQQV